MKFHIDPSLDIGFSGKRGLNPPTESRLKPLSLDVSAQKISLDIIAIHDRQSERKDVDSLFRTVSKIVQSLTGDSFDFSGVGTINVVQEKVPSCMPQFSALKEIACLMTCNSFNASTAHETIKAILEKLRSYTWDAKAVIALAAFALDYGESWRHSLMQVTKQNAPALHVFSLEGVQTDKPTHTIAELNSLVDFTLRLIQKIIDLEEKIAENDNILKKVPAVSDAKKEVYTYWAIFALACASQITELEWDLTTDVIQHVKNVTSELDGLLKEINKFKDSIAPLETVLKAVRSPSGIMELLKALIIFLANRKLKILDLHDNNVVTEDDIKSHNLLLFISGVEDIKEEIEKLQSIADEMETKGNYRILWIPVVEDWTDELKDKFEDAKSKYKLQWYVPKNYETCIDIEVYRKEFHYNGKPIVVVTDPRGKIIHKNAMHMIFVWGIEAFPFRPDIERSLSANWKWLWSGALKFHREVKTWVDKGKHIILYRAVPRSDTSGASLAGLIDKINEISINKHPDAIIEHFDLGTAGDADESKFWDSINHSFYNNYVALKQIARILRMKKEPEWILVSKGPEVLLVDYGIDLMTQVLQVEDWKTHVKNNGFDETFITYYKDQRGSVTECSHLKVVDIRSRVPKGITCPDCNRTMVVKSVTYECCHGIDHSVPAKRVRQAK